MLLLTGCLLFGAEASGQKQLVVLRKENVVLRLYPGDEFVYRLKGSKRIRRSYVNNLLDGAVVAHRDTVPFHKIDRIYFRHDSRINVIGGLLVFGGATLLLIDQVNNSLIHKNDVSFDRGFTTSTLTAIGVGLPMMLIKKRSEKIGYRNRLLVATKNSAFYRSDSRGYISPYMDN